MHLLAVNVDFQYDPIFALGVVTSFDRFMQGYVPETDKESIFNAICRSLEADPDRYRRDAMHLREFATGKSVSDLVAWFEQAATAEWGDDWQQQVKAIANNPKFKYSRLFAIGLFSLFEGADLATMKDAAKSEKALQQVCAALRLPEDKVRKDLELYRSNLEKMAQAQALMADLLAADKKKKAERAAANSSVATNAAPESAETP